MTSVLDPTPPAPAGTTGRRHERRLDIQGLRGIAVLLVVLYHGGFSMHGGFTGVDVFFVISGFVITGTLVRELAETGRLRLGAFYARRVRRLLPALAALLVVVAAADTLLGPVLSQRVTAKTAAAASLFTANAYLFRNPSGYFEDVELNPLQHTWTLAVEEQFYVIFPLLLLLAWKLGPRAAAFAVATVGGASLALCLGLQYVAPTHGGMWQRFAFYGAPTRAWEFAAGALLALLAPRLPVRAALAAGVAGLALILAGALALNGTSHYPDLGALLPVAGAAAVIAAGIGRTHAVTRALAFRPLAWVGDLSYSWYLWHWPLIAFADGLWVADPTAKRLAAVVSIVPAWLSYRYIENPVRFRLRRTRRAVLAVAAVCVVVPLAAAGALVAAQRVVDRQPAMQNWQLATRPHGPFARHCANTPLTVPTNPTCTWPAHDAKGLVVAIGDSNVAHFTEPLANAGERLGLSIAVASLRGCAAAGTFTDIEGTATFGCDRFYAESQRAILRLRPRLVIFAEREDLYLRPTIRLTVHGTAGPADAGAKERLLALGIVRFLAPIQRAGIPVLIVHPIPAIPQPPNRCAVIRVLTDSCGTSISYAAAERNLEPSLRLERRAAAAIPGVAVLDVSKLVCPNGACRSMRGHEFVYYDWGHLTVQGALALTDTFRRVLELHARAD